MLHKEQQAGFTLLEVIVALSLFTIAIIMVTSLYSLSQRSYNQASAKAELSQNARVVMDRISREVRQSREMVTELNSVPENSKQEIMFRDGHDVDQIIYIKYYQDGTDIRRSELRYYFEEEEDVNIRYNTTNESGELPKEEVLRDRLVGEYFETFNFWGTEKSINLSLGLEKDDKEFNARTNVYRRN